MKTKLFTAMLFCTIGIGYSTAQVQTEKNERVYFIDAGTCYGTETSPFIMDERGAKKLHGTYIYAGGGERSSSEAELKFKYNISAACKMGKLHGPINVTSQYTGKYYQFRKGWISSSGSNKLTGNFDEGVPAGTFNIVLNNGTWKLSASMKNNHFVGSLSAVGIYANRLTELQGQFDQNGRMIGTWQVGKEKSMKFVNGVQVNRGTPDVQEMAQKFATGTLSEADLRQKGYFLGDDSIPTKIVVNYILNPEFNIREMNVGFDCTPYNVNVHYTYVFKLNMLTEKGLQVLEKAIKDYRRPYFRYEGTYRQHGDVVCNTDYQFDEKYKLYYLYCGGGFTWEYGTIQEQDFKIYMTEQQKERLQNLIEQQYSYAVQPFNQLINEYNQLNNEYEKRYASDLYICFVNNKTDFIQQLSKLSARDLKEYIEYFTKISAIRTGAHYNKRKYSMVEDGAYILARYDDKYNYFSGLYLNELQTVDSLIETIRSVERYNTDSKQLQNAQETTPLRQILQKAFITLNSEKKNLSEDMRLLSSVQKNMLVADTVMKNNEVLCSQLVGKELKAYKKRLSTLEKMKVKNPELYENFVNELNSLKKEQENIIKQ